MSMPMQVFIRENTDVLTKARMVSGLWIWVICSMQARLGVTILQTVQHPKQCVHMGVAFKLADCV